MSSLFDSLDFYCERLNTSFWSEPVNAVTNLSFFVAALLCYWALKKNPPQKHRNYFYALVLFIFLTAVGSFCFHTFAQRWSHWADILPIFVFMMLSMWFFLRNIFNASIWVSVISLSVFLVITAFGAFPPLSGYINGSTMYLPSIFSLYLFSFWLLHRGQMHDGAQVFAIAIVFSFSLMARTFDHDLCEIIPMGTHFIWHVLNGVVAYLIFQLFLKIESQGQS